VTFIRKSVFRQKVLVEFDPTNPKHRLDFASFLKYDNWRNGCQYLLEDPYMDIPSMCKDKLLSHFLKAEAAKV
jgi:hypothetical protein